MDTNPEPFFPELAQAPGQPQSGPIEHSEVVIAFVAAVGVDLNKAEEAAKAKLVDIGYRVIYIRVTTDVLPYLDPSASKKFPNDFDRIWKMMDIGTNARKKFGNDIVALGIAAEISRRRPKDKAQRTAYLVHSLKHPDEVRTLRELYPRGFYLIGVHSPPQSRRKYLGTKEGIGSP